MNNMGWWEYDHNTLSMSSKESQKRIFEVNQKDKSNTTGQSSETRNSHKNVYYS